MEIYVKLFLILNRSTGVKKNRNHNNHLNRRFYYVYRFSGPEEKSPILSEYCLVEWGFRRRKSLIAHFWFSFISSWIGHYPIAIYIVIRHQTNSYAPQEATFKLKKPWQ